MRGSIGHATQPARRKLRHVGNLNFQPIGRRRTRSICRLSNRICAVRIAMCAWAASAVPWATIGDCSRGTLREALASNGRDRRRTRNLATGGARSVRSRMHIALSGPGDAISQGSNSRSLVRSWCTSCRNLLRCLCWFPEGSFLMASGFPRASIAAHPLGRVPGRRIASLTVAANPSQHLPFATASRVVLECSEVQPRRWPQRSIVSAVIVTMVVNVGRIS